MLSNIISYFFFASIKVLSSLFLLLLLLVDDWEGDRFDEMTLCKKCAFVCNGGCGFLVRYSRAAVCEGNSFRAI